tara:strand:+ start:1370 stop:2035 length:666 start_codon:yes stop_codon:yes gene_type:complete
MSQFLPNPKYNPEFQEEINAKTKLQPGISMAKFLGGVGWADTIEHITPNQLFEDKLKLAKQYHMHAVALSGIAELDDFAYHRVRVAEGYYRIIDESRKYDLDSTLYYRNKGQAVVYEILNEVGNPDPEKTWDLALHFATSQISSIRPQKTILCYDTFHPNERLHAQVCLILPEITSGWNVKYAIGENQVETKYNGFVQSTGELVEILEEKREETLLYGNDI